MRRGLSTSCPANGVPAIGPGRPSARLESSKAFSKAFLVRNNLPTAQAVEFTERSRVRGVPAAHRAAAPCHQEERARRGQGRARIIRPEESIGLRRRHSGEGRSPGGRVPGRLGGLDLRPERRQGLRGAPPCTDFKKAHDGDTGPNTGGMGSICPVPWVDRVADGPHPRRGGCAGLRGAGPGRAGVCGGAVLRPDDHRAGPQGTGVQRAFRRSRDPGAPPGARPGSRGAHGIDGKQDAGGVRRDLPRGRRPRARRSVS